MTRFIKDIKKYWKYMTYSAKSGLKSEVAGSRLGWIWWILEPVLFMFVYWFIFSIVFGNTTKYFPIFVFIGLTIWNFFNKTVMASVKIVKTNKAIVSKVYVPKYTLILIEMMIQAFKMAISFLVIIIMMIIYKVPVSIYLLWFIPVMITLCMVTFGISSIMAHFGVFIEDLKTVLTVFLRVVFYMSGVFYELVPIGRKSKIPEPFDIILSKYNPIAFLMNCARNCLIYSSNVGYKFLFAWFVTGCILSFIGVKVIYKYENSYVKVI